MFYYYAECPSSVCHYAEFHLCCSIIQNIITMYVILLSVLMFCVVMQNVDKLSAIF
jgi:hypothetical protein